jgi:hypothetical protein
MNALARFQASLPEWRPAVEAWLDDLPAGVRTNPDRAALAYLFAAPPMEAIGSGTLADVSSGWIDWVALDERASASGDVERAVLAAARALDGGDPGPALGLMLLFPNVEAFYWVHAAGTVFEIVSQRLQHASFALQ